MIRDCTKCEQYNYKLDLKMWGHPCDLYGGCLKEIQRPQDCTKCVECQKFESGGMLVFKCKLHGGFRSGCNDYQEE